MTVGRAEPAADDGGPGARMYMAAAGGENYYVFTALQDGGGWAPLALAGPAAATHFAEHLLVLPEIAGRSLVLFVVQDIDGSEMSGQPACAFDGVCAWEGERLALFELGDCQLRATLEALKQAVEEATGGAGASGMAPAFYATDETYMLGARDTVLLIEGGLLISWKTEEVALRWLEERGPKGSMVEAELKRLRPHKQSDFAREHVRDYLGAEGEDFEAATLLSWYAGGGQRIALVRTGERTWADNFGPASTLQ